MHEGLWLATMRLQNNQNKLYIFCTVCLNNLAIKLSLCVFAPSSLTHSAPEPLLWLPQSLWGWELLQIQFTMSQNSSDEAPWSNTLCLGESGSLNGATLPRDYTSILQDSSSNAETSLVECLLHAQCMPFLENTSRCIACGLSSK